MSKINLFRKFTWFDFFEFSNAIGTAWNLGKKETYCGKICDYIYALECLQESKEIFVCERYNQNSKDYKSNNFNFETAGYIGYGNKSTHRILPLIFKCILWFFVSNKKQLKDYYKDNRDDKLSNATHISILFVNNNCRNEGVGTFMMNEMLKKIPQETLIKTDTDDYCNIDFYKKIGFNCYYENDGNYIFTMKVCDKL